MSDYQYDYQSRELSLIPLNQEGLKTLKEIQGKDFNEARDKQFYLMQEVKNKNGEVIGINLYIKKAGLERQMERKFGNNYRLILLPVMGEEYNHFRMAENVPEHIPYVVFKSELYLNNNEKPSFVQYASASSESCKKNRHYIEMAQTRASNRVYREATNCGLTSVEEISEKETYDEFKNRQILTSPPKNEDKRLLLNKLLEIMKTVDLFYDKNTKKYIQENITEFSKYYTGKDLINIEEKEEMTTENIMLLIDEATKRTIKISEVQDKVETVNLLSQIETDEFDTNEMPYI